MNKKYITVLDFEVGRVFQYKFVDELEYTDNTYERYLTDKGHRKIIVFEIEF